VTRVRIATVAAMTRLTLKRASASRPDGQWKDEDYDVLADGKVVGRIYEPAGSRFDPPETTLGLVSYGHTRDPWRDDRHRRDARRGDGEVSRELD
jgi:hypothetical protein